MLKTLITLAGAFFLSLWGVLVSTNPESRTGIRRLVLPITAGGDTAGDILSVANPFGVQVQIVGASLEITTASGGAATADFGVAANGTTTSATLFDGVDINATTTYNPTDDSGSGGVLDTENAAVWETGEFITGDILTGTDGALVGQLTLWVRLGGAI